MKLTLRQAQVVALTSVGASAKEIANVLGVGEQTIKTYKKQLLAIQRQHNVDYWGLPLDRDGRNREFRRICNNVMVRYKFGEVQNESSAATHH